MRDYLNLLDNILAEGVGLSNRKQGEVFRNPAGDEIVFQNLNFYPDQGAFETPEQAQEAVAKVAQQLGTTPQMIQWTNKAAPGMLGFGIAVFNNAADNKPYYLGRWFQKISPNRVQNNFPNNAIPGGFKLQSKVGAKENTGYKPSEVLTQFQNNTPQSIQQQIVTKFGQGSPEATAVQVFMSSKGFPITIPNPGDAMNFTAFRDYFGEMLQPMALVLGMKVDGNATEAADIFFGKGKGYKTSTISFNEGVAGGLFDSLLVDASGKQIKLSSKGASGANASVVNLLNCVKELEATPRGQKLIAAHPDVIKILETINKGGHFEGPLDLGVEYKMITNDDKTQILALKSLGPNDPLPLSPKLKQLYDARKPKDASKVIPIEHMTAIIAYQVADYINKNTNFSDAAADILNNSALVQMYTEATQGKETIVIDRFRAVWPSTAVSGVQLRADKSYYSTGGKGNMVFKILKGGTEVAEELGAGSDTELTPLDVDHGIIPSEPDIPAIKKDNLKVYGRRFQR
jgi:hypothetical protein